MNILAIDTSSPILCVAAIRSDGATSEFNLNAGLVHSKYLIESIRQALNMAALKKEDINCLACGLGPGSFTGLRIGMAAVKGFAAVRKLKVMGFSSLDAISENVPIISGKLAVILDARREKLYAAVYETTGAKTKKTLKDSLLTFNDLMKFVDENTVFTGDALKVYGEPIRKKLGRNVCFLDERFWSPRAASLVSLVQKKQNGLKTIPVQKLKPVYLRLSEAEERRKGSYR